MTTLTKSTLLALAALVAGSAAAAQTPRNFAASSNYWSWVDAMQTPADLSMPKEANVGRSSPLHPAYYAANIETQWVGTKASVSSGETRNPLHPQYYRR